MRTAVIEIPDAVYRRAERAAKARGVSFAAFARAEIERGAKPAKKWHPPGPFDFTINPSLTDADLKEIAQRDPYEERLAEGLGG
ncbi:MAG: hypothetical protein LBW77_00265 [Verrucomicrobiota bacterium]|jgi:hypothetical protein|nr:hypothetical protein [Verrucomicrobiota bacterium]